MENSLLAIFDEIWKFAVLYNTGTLYSTVSVLGLILE